MNVRSEFYLVKVYIYKIATNPKILSCNSSGPPWVHSIVCEEHFSLEAAALAPIAPILKLGGKKRVSLSDDFKISCGENPPFRASVSRSRLLIVVILV